MSPPDLPSVPKLKRTFSISRQQGIGLLFLLLLPIAALLKTVDPQQAMLTADNITVSYPALEREGNDAAVIIAVGPELESADLKLYGPLIIKSPYVHKSSLMECPFASFTKCYRYNFRTHMGRYETFLIIKRAQQEELRLSFTTTVLP